MEPIDPNSPGGRLREARKARKWSQMELAVAAGFSRPHITHMELNTYRGGRAAWEAVAGALHRPIDYFLNGPNDPPDGFADTASIPANWPAPPDETSDDHFAETAAQIEQMLIEERMPHDARTLAKMAAELWREVQKLPRLMPFEDRVAFVVSERRSKVQRARASMFLEN